MTGIAPIDSKSYGFKGEDSRNLNPIIEAVLTFFVVKILMDFYIHKKSGQPHNNRA